MKGTPSMPPSPRTQVILATDMWAAFTVDTWPRWRWWCTIVVVVEIVEMVVVDH